MNRLKQFKHRPGHGSQLSGRQGLGSGRGKSLCNASRRDHVTDVGRQAKPELDKQAATAWRGCAYLALPRLAHFSATLQPPALPFRSLTLSLAFWPVSSPSLLLRCSVYTQDMAEGKDWGEIHCTPVYSRAPWGPDLGHLYSSSSSQIALLLCPSLLFVKAPRASPKPSIASYRHPRLSRA